MQRVEHARFTEVAALPDSVRGAGGYGSTGGFGALPPGDRATADVPAKEHRDDCAARRPSPTPAARTPRPPGEPGHEAADDATSTPSAVDLAAGPYDSGDVPDDGGSGWTSAACASAHRRASSCACRSTSRPGASSPSSSPPRRARWSCARSPAPRAEGTWDDTRRQIAAETARRGGTATESDGPWGTELRTRVPVQTPEGEQAYQPARVIGIDGPRWLLRATILGRPSVEPEAAGPYVEAIRSVAVHRGNDPMAPGDALPLSVPSNAQRLG